jgi:hypothetical protein
MPYPPDRLPDPFDRLDLFAATGLVAVGGSLACVSALAYRDLGLLLIGVMAVVWGVQKFYAFWKDEDVELPIPAVLLRIVFPLAAIWFIASTKDAWLLGGVFSALLIAVQTYYLFVMRPKQDREQGRELRPWWR